MSYTSVHPGHATSSTPTLRGNLLAVLSRAGSALRRLIRAYNTRHALMKLDDAMLKDIGLSRSDIEAVVHRTGRD